MDDDNVQLQPPHDQRVETNEPISIFDVFNGASKGKIMNDIKNTQASQKAGINIQLGLNTNFPITLGYACMICYDTSENSSTSKCGHIACQRCWDTWLKTKLECPMCKKKVRPKTLIKLYPNPS